MLSCKEALLGLYDSTVVTDTLTITATEKPSTPDLTVSAVIPYTATSSTCNEVKLKRAAGQVKLNFTNLDASNPHTVYYQIYVDGVLTVDNSAGSVIAMGGTLAKTELIGQADPADATLSVTMYFWASAASQIRLDDHRVKAGFGSESVSAEALRIEKESMQGLYAALLASDTTPVYALKALNSGVSLATGTTSIALSTMLPESRLYLTPPATEFIYLTGISSV
ncbi:MAG TPA: hypothetical protein VMY37_13215 [Thermoguttaceae bacterium]|nr:hypothetical protein [Thermoguttaceae bacterium]